MAFGIKNIGATYKRAMVTIFHDLIHKLVEVYVDDILTKFVKREDHLEDLRVIFERMRQVNLNSNTRKCVFGVSSYG